MIPATGRLLEKTELEHFANGGYVIAEDVIPTEELQPVIDEISEEIDIRAKTLHEAGHISQTYADEGFETRLACISRETDKLALQIWNGILHGPAIFHLLTNPNLLNIAEQLVGDEIIASSAYRLRPKIPNYGYGAVPWHQDSAYFEPYCDKDLVLTMWLPLVDATEENGCLWVIPNSHRSPVVRHVMSSDNKYLKIDGKEFPHTGRRVACPVKKGGVLLMTNRTAHASFKNTTEGVRWSMDLRYQNAKLPTNADITHMPGDQVGNGSDIPVACYPPEPDFLVRSTKRPNEVITTAQQFAEIREKYAGKPLSKRFAWQP
jgi:ectoine hydroxylase-related dioxygenase (phytanoyl-CoA dioxygenase family)